MNLYHDHNVSEESPAAPEPPAGQPPVGQPPAGQPPAGQPPAGQPPAGQPPAGQPLKPSPLGELLTTQRMAVSEDLSDLVRICTYSVVNKSTNIVHCMVQLHITVLP